MESTDTEGEVLRFPTTEFGNGLDFQAHVA